MNVDTLSSQLDSVLGQDINDWQREELSEQIAQFPEGIQKEVLKQLPVIWPVSYALFYAFVEKIENAAQCLKRSQVSSWVLEVLDVYESKGLRQAQIYMDEVESKFVCQIRGENGMQYHEVESLLKPYIKGIAKREVSLAPSEAAYTDTNTIFLPQEINAGNDPQKSFQLYKFTATFQLGLDLVGTFDSFQVPKSLMIKLQTKYNLNVEQEPDSLSVFFEIFPEQQLAEELFFLLEAFRVVKLFKKELAGLISDMQPVFVDLYENEKLQNERNGQRSGVETLRNMLLWSCIKGAKPQTTPDSSEFGPDFFNKINQLESRQESLVLTEELFEYCFKSADHNKAVSPLPFMGKLHVQLALQGKEERRKEVSEKFVQGLAHLLASANKQKDKDGEAGNLENMPVDSSEQGTILDLDGDGELADELGFEDRSEEGFIVIGGEEVALPTELRELASKIRKDFGEIPGMYISSSIGRAGGISSGLDVKDTEEGQLLGEVIYDEWDFRRMGFRKNWCRLHEKEVSPAKGTFVDSTLEKYKGQLINLRRQFEMISVQERFLKRQREGDDIDLDAVIEALSDKAAGFAPSERLFVRLQRDQRDIAALFLVDMSSSTEGWVSTALKEALILMCESLSVLGDRYAIYGFSGMRRTRCEFFKVKDFIEHYDEQIKAKIAAITPKEYTRMGPAIRHATAILEDMDSNVRLLITLSDGKPEDYDDYKGAYAIEDTRHALIESKSAGVHPFCITVDRQAHEYIAHMYGEVNYIFIDDVVKLPHRIPEIYRNLTT